MVNIADDIANERGLFVSPDICREVIFPHYRRFTEAAHEMGMFATLHICGKPEDIVPDLPALGWDAWEICQPINDLSGLQTKLKDDLCFLGCADTRAVLEGPGSDEERCRAEARRTIDLYGPAGNFGFQGFVVTDDLSRTLALMDIMGDEAQKYGENYYVK